MRSSPTDCLYYPSLLTAYEAYADAVMASPVFPLADHSTKLMNAQKLKHLEKRRAEIKKFQLCNTQVSVTAEDAQQMRELLDHLTAKTLLLKKITNLHTNISVGEFGICKDLGALDYCQTIPADLLERFRLAVVTVASSAGDLVKDIIRRKNVNQRGDKPTVNDIKLLTEVIEATDKLFNNPTESKRLNRVSKSLDALQRSPFNYQALAGNVLTVVGVTAIILLFPTIAVTCGFPLGLGVAIVAFITAMIGQAIKEESYRQPPAYQFFKDTQLTTDGNHLKTVSKQVQKASGRYGCYGFFNALCNTSVIPHNADIAPSRSGLTILTR
jgi:RNA polymerase-binding transcription factor DksA